MDWGDLRRGEPREGRKQNEKVGRAQQELVLRKPSQGLIEGGACRSCPTLRPEGGAVELLAQAVIGLVVMGVGGACQVVPISQEQSSEGWGEGAPAAEGTWAGRWQHPTPQVYLQHSLGGGTGGAA